MKLRSLHSRWLFQAVLATFAFASPAWTLEINWSTIDGGGGLSSGGSFSLFGVIGQPDAAMSTGGTFSLQGGFLVEGVAGPTPTPTPTSTPTPTPTPMATPAPPCVVMSVSLNGTQEVPPNGSSAVGFASITIDTVSNVLTYELEFFGLTGAQTAAHIHGFAPPGMNANPLHTINNGSPVVGMWNYTEDQEDEIISGQTYINVHSEGFVDGEIRGQIANGVACERFIDFTTGGGNAQGWIGAPVPGFGGATSIGLGGLCMIVPALGDNFVLWLSPERYVDLVDNVVYRFRSGLITDQQTPDAIPLWFFVYDNFVSPDKGNNYGGFYWVLDVDGGAQGVNRAQGRGSYEFYAAPIAAPTDQWEAGAFTPAADLQNDMRLQYRIIDANASLLTDADSGTICISNLRINAFARDSIDVESVPYDAPLSNATHFAQAFGDPGVGGTAFIDDVAMNVVYQLPVSGTARRTLGPFDPLQPNFNTQLYPVVWAGDSLYRARTSIRAQSSELDPVDAVFLSVDVTNSELGMVQYVTSGAVGGPLFTVGSPKLASGTYEAYFFSHNATASVVPDANRLRPLAFFFNTPELVGDNTGGAGFIVESLATDKLVLP